MEGLNQNQAPSLKEKEDIEWKNKKENNEYLISKFSEKLAEAPIVVYLQHGEGAPQKKDTRTFNKVERVFTNQFGTGAGVSVQFDKDNWIGVSIGTVEGKIEDKVNGRVDTSYPFDKNNGFYKITEETFQNILSIMSELIERSSCPDTEKQKMFQLVIDNFRNKIIKDEDVEKIEK